MIRLTHFLFFLLVCCLLLSSPGPLSAYENLLNVGGDKRAEPEPPKIEVKGFSLSGNTCLPDSLLQKKLQPFVGRELSFQELKQTTDLLTSEYFQRGYVTSYAWLPEQEIENGNIKIQISEGTTGDIEVYGNHNFKSSFIRRHFTNTFAKDDVLNNLKLERAALILNDIPNLSVKTHLEPAEESGRTNIRVETAEKVPAPVHGSIFFSNHGSRFTGHNRLGANWTLANVTGNADYIDMTLMMSPNHESWRNMLYGKAAYTAPIGYRGTRLSLGYEVTGYDLGGRLKPLGIQGDSTLISLGLSHPLRRSRERNLFLTGGITKKDHKNYLFERTLNTSTDQYSVFEAGLNGDCQKEKRSLAWSVLLTSGLGEAFGGMDDRDYINSSRPNKADGSWTKFNLAINGTFTQNQQHKLVLRGEGQFSNDALLSPEQGSLGGPTSVRAYPISEYSGDQSYLLAAEYHVPFRKNSRPRSNAGWLVFVDHGGTHVNSRIAGERDGSLTGAGVGLRFNFARDLSLALDAAFPACDEDASDGDHARFWLSVTQQF